MGGALAPPTARKADISEPEAPEAAEATVHRPSRRPCVNVMLVSFTLIE